ncbi:MAG: amino acid transporter substrate-binding protein [Proteobacteria bacterium]|nr:amino acid transporter substrate-binding protein [Pseudomonadota bacterium]
MIERSFLFLTRRNMPTSEHWRVLWAIPVLALLFTPPSILAKGQESGHLERILASKILRVCIWPDYYSISYRNPKTQQLSGIDIDLAKELAKDLDPKIDVKFVDSSFATLSEDINRDRCDIGMFAIGITSARAKTLRFSKPYLTSDIYAVATRTNRRIKEWQDIDQPGVVVAVHKGTYHEGVMREQLKRATLLVADTPFAREQEVESGRADVFMTDYPYSQRMLQNAQWARLIIPPTTYHLSSYAYVVRYGDERWHERVERFISDIKRDGRLLSAAKQHKLEPIVQQGQ